MVLAPNTRLIKIALAALVGAVAALAAVVAIASPAGAQTGARGTAYQHDVRATSGNRMQLSVAGYAYNRNSMPVQDVKAVVYGQQQRGSVRHRLYASKPHPADGKHYAARTTGRHVTKSERAYTFAWHSPAFAAAPGSAKSYPYLTLCLYARDAGSHRGYTKIDKCRPVEQSARHNS